MKIVRKPDPKQSKRIRSLVKDQNSHNMKS